MTSSHIFKMELFKYVKDKTYLITTGVLAIINVILTIYFTNIFDSFMYNDSALSSTLFGFMILFLVLTILANIAFMFFYPFHLLSMDYRNDVMSLLVASGVNRTRLFFAKIGGALLWSFCLMLILVFVPFAITLLSLFQISDMQLILASFGEYLNIAGLSVGMIIFSSIFSYINSLVLLATATIILRGKMSSIILFVGFNMLQSLIISFLGLIPVMLNFSVIGATILNQLFLFGITLIFILLSLKVMKSQNL